MENAFCANECVNYYLFFLQILHGKLSGTVTAASKARCWEEVAMQVSCVSGVPREVSE